MTVGGMVCLLPPDAPSLFPWDSSSPKCARNSCISAEVVASDDSGAAFSAVATLSVSARFFSSLVATDIRSSATTGIDEDRCIPSVIVSSCFPSKGSFVSALRSESGFGIDDSLSLVEAGVRGARVTLSLLREPVFFRTEFDCPFSPSATNCNSL